MNLLIFFGWIPYVHHSLFQACTIEQMHPSLTIPDEAFANIFNFFDIYQWRMNKIDTKNQNVLYPSILGTLFEQYVNQQQMGSYYTKKDITGYIAQNTILPSFFDRVIHIHQHSKLWHLLQEDPNRYIYDAIKCENYLPGETSQEYHARRNYYTTLQRKIATGQITEIDDLITFNLDICQLSADAIRQIEDPTSLQHCYEQLQQMTILDPTSGAGAFLFAAIKTLTTMYEACLERMQTIPQSL